jgi:hypothetical protein
MFLSIPVHSRHFEIQMTTCIFSWSEEIPSDKGISPWGCAAQVLGSLVTKLALIEFGCWRDGTFSSAPRLPVSLTNSLPTYSAQPRRTYDVMEVLPTLDVDLRPAGVARNRWPGRTAGTCTGRSRRSRCHLFTACKKASLRASPAGRRIWPT